MVKHIEGAVGSLGDDQASQLEPLRQINSSFEAVVSLATGVPTEKMILSSVLRRNPSTPCCRSLE